MKAYFIRITEPMQIPAVVYEAKARAVEDLAYVFLDHQERPNVVRGRFQPMEGRSGIAEVKRPDGGLSWYHPHTRCMIRAMPNDDGMSIAGAQESWGNGMKEWMVRKGYKASSVVYNNSDLYIVNGSTRHVMGMSGKTGIENGATVKLQRACWYEKNPLNDIADMLKADGISPDAFKQRLQIVQPGLFESIANKLQAEEVLAEEFISQASMDRAVKLQLCTSGSYRGSCVMGVKENI